MPVIEKLEMLVDKENSRKFYPKVEQFMEAFKTSANSGRNKHVRKHYITLLKGTVTRREDEPEPSVGDDRVDVPQPDHI